MKTGQKIRKLRIAAGLTQEQLARMVNVSPQVISNWERGYTPTIDHEDILRLAIALKTTTDHLLDGPNYYSTENNDMAAHDSSGHYSNQIYDLDEIIDRGHKVTIDGKPISNDERERLKEHLRVAIRTMRESKNRQG